MARAAKKVCRRVCGRRGPSIEAAAISGDAESGPGAPQATAKRFGCGFAEIPAATGTLPGYREIALAVAGVGFGIVMPSVIKAVIGGIDQRHAGLASGIVISTFQIGAALGVAIVGGVFFSALGSGQDVAAHTHAFAVALGCNVAPLVFGGVLSLWIPGEPRIAEFPLPTEKVT